jgi:hypothetical protein
MDADQAIDITLYSDHDLRMLHHLASIYESHMAQSIAGVAAWVVQLPK